MGKRRGEDTVIIDDIADADEITRQLDYYKNKEVTTDNYGDAIKIYDNGVGHFGSDSLNWYWWLRTPTANYGMFYYVSMWGNDTFFLSFSNSWYFSCIPPI